MAFPERLDVDGFEPYPDLAILVVEQQHARLRASAIETHIADAEAMERVGRAAHAGDIEALPLRTVGTEHQAPRTRYGAAPEQPLTEGETVRVLLVAMPAVVHGTQDAGRLLVDGAHRPAPVIQLDRQLALKYGIGHASYSA